MKKSVILIVTLFIALTGFAQQGINYKAVIKDGNGDLVTSQEIDAKFSILEDTGSSVVYMESHDNVTTDANGIVILNIGEGTTTDDFTAIDWGDDTHSLKTEIDLDDDANFDDLGTTSFKTVPYAIHSKTAENTFSGDYNDLINQPEIPDPLGGFSQFENIRVYYEVGASNWIVPAAVTKIGVELLGGGGAGSSNGGGAGGTYVAFIIDVTPGSSIPYQVGTRGTYNGSVDGNASTITIGGIQYEAGGGGGAGAGQNGADNNPFPTGFGRFFKALGQPGTANDYSYSYGPSGNTLFKTQYGSGGGTYPAYKYTPGGTRLKNLNTNTDLHITNCTTAFSYGSGGAANVSLSVRNNGRGGFIRIHY